MLTSAAVTASTTTANAISTATALRSADDRRAVGGTRLAARVPVRRRRFRLREDPARRDPPAGIRHDQDGDDDRDLDEEQPAVVGVNERRHGADLAQALYDARQRNERDRRQRNHDETRERDRAPLAARLGSANVTASAQRPPSHTPAPPT